MTRPSSPSRIVVGVDGSTSSIAALLWAQKMGTALNLGIDVVTSWQYPNGWGMASAGIDWNPGADASILQATALDKAFGDHHPAGLTATTVEGHPAETLLRLSAAAEMLVVGSRGHGGFVGMVLGSVSAHCAELATCPVVVVHSHP